MCNGVRTGGPWNPQEQTMHINCLELLAAHLAVKCFAKNKTNLTIHLKMDSVSALTYIQQIGGTISPQLKLPSQRAMAVVHGEEYPSQGTTPTWCCEHHSRRQVEGHERPLRLDTKPSNIPQDKPQAGTSEGAVCQQADSSTASLCQLETGSDGHDHGCFYNERH